MNNKKISREEFDSLVKKVETLTNLMNLCRRNSDSCKERLDANDEKMTRFQLVQDELKESIDENWGFTNKNRQTFDALCKIKEINQTIEHHLPLIQRAEERNFLGLDDSKNDEDEEMSDRQTVEIGAL